MLKCTDLIPALRYSPFLVLLSSTSLSRPTVHPSLSLLYAWEADVHHPVPFGLDWALWLGCNGERWDAIWGWVYIPKYTPGKMLCFSYLSPLVALSVAQPESQGLFHPSSFRPVNDKSSLLASPSGTALTLLVSLSPANTFVNSLLNPPQLFTLGRPSVSCWVSYLYSLVLYTILTGSSDRSTFPSL